MLSYQGSIFQSSQENPTSAIQIPVHLLAVCSLNYGASTKVCDNFASPTGRFRGIGFADIEHGFAILEGFVLEEHLEAVVGKGQHVTDGFLPQLSGGFTHHLRGFKGRQEDHIEVGDEEQSDFVVEFINQVPNLPADTRGGFVEAGFGRRSGRVSSRDQIIKMGTEPLNTREITRGKPTAGVFGKEGRKRTYARIERYDTALVLGFVSWRCHRDGQIVRAIRAYEATIPMDGWQRFTTAQRAKQRVIDTVPGHGRFRHIERLHGLMLGAEMHVQARTIGVTHALFRQAFDLCGCLAGITYRDGFDLRGDCRTPGRERREERAFDRLPGGLCPWLLQVLDRSVVDKARRATPALKDVALCRGW